MSGARVLVVDDERAACEAMADDLSAGGHDVRWCTSAAEALALLESQDFDVVLTDLRMRGQSGLDLCQQLGASRPDIPVIVVTGFGSLETAVATIRAGAFDFLQKPFAQDALQLAVERAVHNRSLRRELKRLRENGHVPDDRDGLLGQSDEMRRVRELVGRVAQAEPTVLITGESGTGKELVARALHARGPRRDGPFVAVNCAALPETLLESELFGHARGAFTDARTARRGLFLEANRGTLFLDEIGDMPLPVQGKLLRALEQRTVRPVGGNEEIPFDARVVSATHRDLESAVLERTFREDLYYRIHVITIELPPLRARSSDVLALASRFVAELGAERTPPVTGISPAVAERFLHYGWPGNVRELRNCVARAVALARFDQLTLDDLPERLRAHRSGDVVIAFDDPSELATLDEIAQRYVTRVYHALGENKSATARTLGLDRKTLYRRLARAGLLAETDDASD